MCIRDSVSDAYAEAADVSLGDCAAAARMLCGKFRAGEFDELYVVYTNFVSMLSQQPAVMKILPLYYCLLYTSAPESILRSRSSEAFRSRRPSSTRGL